MHLFNTLSDFIVGPCFRNLPSNDKTIYLTFDDGPNSYCTPQILDVLKKHKAKVTFFVIGNNIKENKDVFNQIVKDGHSIGNHSFDHSTTIFFKGKNALSEWIDKGEATICKHLGEATIGFRPPVGIRTPELRLIMKQKNEKPIMWQHRFYDTKKGFTEEAWKNKYNKIKSGDIILLHDTHKQADVFLSSLNSFIQTLINDGYELKGIEKTHLKK